MLGDEDPVSKFVGKRKAEEEEDEEIESNNKLKISEIEVWVQEIRHQVEEEM